MSIAEDVVNDTSRWDKYKSKFLSTYNNALVFLEESKVLIRYNDFANIVEFDGRRYDDNDILNVKERMRNMRMEMSVGTVDEAIKTVALRHRYHPVKEYLGRLAWDGTPRVDTWLVDTCGAAPGPYTAFVSRIALLAAVYRIYHPGCQYDTMVILEGDQGIGKSKVVRALGGEWYKSIPLTDRDKDTIQLMQGAWFIEVPELSVFAKRDIESLKAFISNPSDAARFAYGRNDRVYPRQSVFLGTINPETNGYLMDSTGNRRFMPVRLGEIQPERVESMRDQLFAEAVDMYKRKLPVYANSRDLIKLTGEQQKAREFHDDWTTAIVNYFQANRLDTTDRVTALDVYTRVFGGRAENYDQRISRRIANILRNLGCGDPVHTHVNGLQGKYFDVTSILSQIVSITEKTPEHQEEGWKE